MAKEVDGTEIVPIDDWLDEHEGEQEVETTSYEDCGCQDECCIIDYACVVFITPLEEGRANPSQVYKMINLAQKLFVQHVPKKCLDALCEDLKSNGQEGLSAENLLLLEAIREPLAWYVFYKWMQHYGRYEYLDKVYVNLPSRSASNKQSPEQDSFNAQLGIARTTFFSLLTVCMKELEECEIPCLMPEKKADSCDPCQEDDYYILPISVV